ncbi:MAG: hypothetical protein HC869_04705 [Rhodospirillales bacterium]|nr:hypothetical protein [Rhodospirillales bacterium]
MLLMQPLKDFARSLPGSEAGVFFYAGHGLQVAGKNYLVPVDAKVEDEASLDFELVQLDLVHRTMGRHTVANVLIFDACRNNPFVARLARAMGARAADGLSTGLARPKGGAGTLISFSTQPGNVALDGSGRNSPFTGALVRHLARAAIDDIQGLLIDVRNEVMRATNNAQVPWEDSSLISRFYFGKPALDASVQAGVPQYFQYHYNYPPVGWRYWYRDGVTRWIERYPDGTQNNFAVARRVSLDGCDGVLLIKLRGDVEAEPTTEVFIPDQRCALQLLRFRFTPSSAKWIVTEKIEQEKWMVAGKIEQARY